MAQGRFIDRVITISEGVGNLPIEGQLLYTWMIPYADDLGILQASPRTVKAQVFGMMDTTVDKVGKLLNQMVDEKLLTRFTYQDQNYLYITQFEKFQKLRHDIYPTTILPISTTSKKTTYENWEHCLKLRDEAILGQICTESVTSTERDVTPTERNVEEVKLSKDKIRNTNSDNTENEPKAGNSTHTATRLVLEKKGKREVQSIGSVLQQRVAPKPESKAQSEWQEKAERYAKKLGIPLSPKDESSWFRVFKLAHLGKKTGNLEKAYSYLSDYKKPIAPEEKILLFFKIYHKGLAALSA